MTIRITKRKAVTFLFAAAIVLVGLSGTPCFADFIWMDPNTSLDGTLTVAANEIIAGGSWGSGTEFYYNVTRPLDPTAPLHYYYEFTASASPGLSHFILEVSGAADDLAAFTLAPPDYLNGPTGEGYEILLDDYSSGGPNPSEPGDTWEIFSIKFGDMFTGSGPWTVEFDSYRLPMEGSFYSKGGSDSYAYNTGLVGGEDFILVPDTAYVPAPGAVLLGILGLSVVGYKLRKYA